MRDSTQVTDDHQARLAGWRIVGLEGSFEASLDTLDEIVAFLETGRHGLDDTVAAYEIGVLVAQRCQELLSGAELRISQITVDAELARRSLPEGNDLPEADDQEPDASAEAPF